MDGWTKLGVTVLHKVVIIERLCKDRVEKSRYPRTQTLILFTTTQQRGIEKTFRFNIFSLRNSIFFILFFPLESRASITFPFKRAS